MMFTLYTVQLYYYQTMNWKQMKDVVVAKSNILFWYILRGLHKTVIMKTHLQADN
jgi:hypothetical protein